jgi:hypothetical protein
MITLLVGRAAVSGKSVIKTKGDERGGLVAPDMKGEDIIG